MPLEKHLQRLITTEGFIQAFWEMSSEYPGSQEKAYNAVEEMYQDNFGTRKYSGLESFRSVMYRYLKNVKKEKK